MSRLDAQALVDLLERVVVESDSLPDWPAIRRKVVPLVGIAGADLTPAGRRRLRAELDDVNWHPRLYALLLAFALRGELPLDDPPPAADAPLIPGPPPELLAKFTAALRLGGILEPARNHCQGGERRSWSGLSLTIGPC